LPFRQINFGGRRLYHKRPAKSREILKKEENNLKQQVLTVAGGIGCGDRGINSVATPIAGAQRLSAKVKCKSDTCTQVQK